MFNDRSDNTKDSDFSVKTSRFIAAFSEALNVRSFLTSIALILTGCVSAAAVAQNAVTFSDAATPGFRSTSYRTLQEELELNEGILSYQMGDYDDALTRCEPLQSTSDIAAECCNQCEANLSGESDSNWTTEYSSESGVQCSDDSAQYAGVQPNRPWNFTVLTGYQYDSNVSLASNFVGLGSITDKSDSSWYLASFGDFRLLEDSTQNVGLIMSTYSNWYQERTDFNLQDYMGGAYTNRVLADNIIGGVRYEYHKTLLNNDSFSSEHRIVPNISFLRGDHGHTTLFYEFDSINFDAQPLIPALDPSAHVQATGITRARYTFEGQGRIFAGYRFENATAEGSDFDRQTHQVNGRFEIPLTCKLIWDAGVRYFWDDYANANSLDFWGNARQDERLEVRTGLQKIHNRHLSSRLDYTFTDSDSNVANLFDVRFFDYAKHSLTAQIIYDF